MIAYRGVALQYGVDAARLPAELRRAFVELDADGSTRAWIDHSLSRPRPRAKIALRTLAMAVMNIYDANGLVSICQDRLLGAAQWRLLLGAQWRAPLGAPGAPGKVGGRLLDVGAGDGEITRELAALFTEVTTTEVSRPMARRLRQKGYRCHRCDIAFDQIDGRFDVVALQNVLDRTTHPLRLLDRAGELLADGGRLIVAAPIPIEPVVFRGPTRSAPAETLPVGPRDFEGAVTALWTQVFEPRGYRVTALSRAPYLCNGSAFAPVEQLDDAIFVLARGG